MYLARQYHNEGDLTIYFVIWDFFAKTHFLTQFVSGPERPKKFSGFWRISLDGDMAVMVKMGK